MGWSGSADPRRRQFEVKKGENDALKREIVEIENKRIQEHRDITSDVSIDCTYQFIKENINSSSTFFAQVGLELAPLMDARLTSTDITKHAAQQTVQPWHSKENKAQYWNQLTGKG